MGSISGKSFGPVSVISIEDAAQLMKDKRRSQQVVLIDLGENATTLHCDTKIPALHTGCIVLGFEMKGIPDVLTVLGDLSVQLPTRRSINLVASVAIVLHCIRIHGNCE